MHARLDELAREARRRPARAAGVRRGAARRPTWPTPVGVRCDPLLVATALDNLIRNAIEAAVVAKDLGAVDAARGAGVGAAGRTARRMCWSRTMPAVRPPDVEAHLFEPFVTSKPKGIGLGLSMARQAVEQQGGSLAFERSAARQPLHGRALPVEAPCMSRATLLVDDDRAFASLAAAALQREGLPVVAGALAARGAQGRREGARPSW